MRWLFEAKKRYGLCVLNYMVTSNHIHLLVEGSGGEVLGAKGSYELREPEAAYSCNFDTENGPLSLENAYFWDDY